MLYILMLHQGFTRVNHSTTAQPDSLTPAQSFRVALDYLVSSDSPTYHDVSAHLRSFLCRAFTFFFLPARMLVLKPDRSGRTWLYNDEGLRTSTLRISLKDFRRSSWIARRRNDVVTKRQQLVGFEGDDLKKEDRKTKKANLRVSRREKDIYWVAGGLEERETARK